MTNLNMMHKKLVPLLVTALMTGLLAACGGGNSGTKGTDSTELTVLLDWYPNAVHTFLFAAEQQGYFKEAGLKVNLQPPSDTNDAIKLVAAGKADLALSYQPQIVLSRSEGLPVRSVAAVVRHPLNHLMTKADSGIASPKDLAGKTVGYSGIAEYEAFVRTMVIADGGDPAQVKFVDIGFDLIPALTTNKVAAISGGFINHEKLLLEKDGINLTAFDPVKYGVPDYYELVLAASEDGLEKKKDAIQAFLEAAKKGQAYTVSHPDEALKVLLDKQSGDFPLDADIEKKSLSILLPLMDAGSEPFGAQSEKSWQKLADWMYESNLIGKQVAGKDAFADMQK